MAFWGVEVKPTKPVVHSCENARGRLRITQACLGTGSAIGRCLVQCKVGTRSPFYLCVLMAGTIESCHLELELEEADEVTFSVLGPRSVYLTGYFLHKDVPSHHPSDTESYGIDIQNTASEESKSSREDDDQYDYKDGFIDDSELGDSEPAPVSHFRGKRILSDRRQRGKQIIESDGDEDGYLFNVFRRDTPIKKLPDILEDEGTSVKYETKEQKGRALRISCEQERDDSENFLVRASSENCLESRKEKREVETVGDLPEGGEMVSNLAEKEETTTLSHEQCLVDDLSCSQFKATTAKRKRKSKKEKCFDLCDGDVKNNEEEKNSIINGEEGAEKMSVEKIPSSSKQMVMEELAKGDPNGKIAFTGREVKIHYTGMLKESGFVIDSTVGKEPWKFILGDEEVIEAFNVGIEGMRLGDKRRLTFPPSMGFGERGVDGVVSPNSWLVYDVELVRVHRLEQERKNNGIEVSSATGCQPEKRNQKKKSSKKS